MAKEREGRVTVRRPYEDTVEAVFEGHVTGALVEHSVAKGKAFLLERRARWYFTDAMGLTSFDKTISGPGTAAVKEIFAMGVEEVLVATSMASARMVGSAIAFATGRQIRFFGKREDALQYMIRHRR